MATGICRSAEPPACDHVTTIPKDRLGAQVGVLLDAQEQARSDATRAAFDLD